MERTEWQDPPDPDAATIADEAPGEDLRAYVHAWRAGSDLMAAELARNAQFSLKRPVQTLSAACEALCRHACRRQPALLQRLSLLARSEDFPLTFSLDVNSGPTSPLRDSSPIA